MAEKNPETGSEYVVVKAAKYDTDGKIIGREDKNLDKLWPSDMMRLANQLTKMRREKLERNIEVSKMPWEEAFERLNAFDSRPIDRGDVTAWGILPDGVCEVLKASLKHQNPSADDATLQAEVDKLALNQIFAVRAAAGCLDIILTTPKGDNKDPKANSGDGNPATGSATPPPDLTTSTGQERQNESLPTSTPETTLSTGHSTSSSQQPAEPST